EKEFEKRLGEVRLKTLAVLANEMLMEGRDFIINVKEAANTRLSTGPYVYQIETNSGNFSKSIVIS
ncbi:MAG: hypothetical protein AAF705_14785, partial [Bacteroidota bacterium]